MYFVKGGFQCATFRTSVCITCYPRLYSSFVREVRGFGANANKIRFSSKAYRAARSLYEEMPHRVAIGGCRAFVRFQVWLRPARGGEWV